MHSAPLQFVLLPFPKYTSSDRAMRRLHLRCIAQIRWTTRTLNGERKSACAPSRDKFFIKNLIGRFAPPPGSGGAIDDTFVCATLRSKRQWCFRHYIVFRCRRRHRSTLGMHPERNLNRRYTRTRNIYVYIRVYVVCETTDLYAVRRHSGNVSNFPFRVTAILYTVIKLMEF